MNPFASAGPKPVTTFAVVWIEIFFLYYSFLYPPVTTFAVVWIEMLIPSEIKNRIVSPPSRWCGLKFQPYTGNGCLAHVTTFAVVWIEILPRADPMALILVTTFAVVWIEI